MKRRGTRCRFAINDGRAVCLRFGRYCSLALGHLTTINISLERMVSLAQTVACLVGQQLDEAVGQDNVSSDVESSVGSGNHGAAASVGRPLSPARDEQVHWSVVKR